jgi:zinc finger protein 830
MSSVFRLEKKQISQHELRRLMNEQKSTRNAEQPIKIENLFCKICKKQMKSEKLYVVHVNSKQHKDNVAVAKELKAKIDNQSKPVATLKRTIIETKSDQVPEKKLKSILKNSSTSISTNLIQNINNNTVDEVQPKGSAIPDDFFDTTPVIQSENKSQQNENENEIEKGEIPENFFDDAVKDAKARNQVYKDAELEEWNKFKKEIKEAEDQSKVIINEEHEEATVERQIDEIDEQIRNWSR